jgi:hypothetical protein
MTYQGEPFTGGRLTVEKRFDDQGHLAHEEHWDEEGNPVPFPRTGMPE